MPVGSLLLASLPQHYNAVLAAATSVGFLITGQVIAVSRARAACGLRYPAAYADSQQVKEDTTGKMNQFNCAQRAHANTLEHLPVFFFTLLYSGLEFPRLAAAFGFIFIAGRVFYTVGYLSGEPAKRRRGTWGSFGALGLLCLSAWVTVQQFI